MSTHLPMLHYTASQFLTLPPCPTRWYPLAACSGYTVYERLIPVEPMYVIFNLALSGGLGGLFGACVAISGGRLEWWMHGLPDCQA